MGNRITQWFQVKSFKDIFNAGKNNFQIMFKDLDNVNIAELMKVFILFPVLINERLNVELEHEISKEELKAILSSFKRAKIPRIIGYIVGFYLGLYELIDNELLRMVEESRISRKVLGALNSTFIDFIPKNNEPSSCE